MKVLCQRPAVSRRSLLLCAVVCLGILGTGCASDSGEGSSGTSEQPATGADPSLPADAEQAPTASAPPSDPLAPTTSTAPEQDVEPVEKPAPSDQLAEPAEPVEKPAPSDQLAEPAEPVEKSAPSDQLAEPAEAVEPEAATAAGDSSGDAARPEAAQDQPRAGSSVFPPVVDGGDVARWTVEIIEAFPHDPDAFTQGLEIAGGTMYESTGLRGRSSLRTVDAFTGEVTASVHLPDELFGEGLTIVGDTIIQLTWTSETALLYDRLTLDALGAHAYEGEGWGLCLSGDVLIMSDGSNRLARRDPETFTLVGTATVTAPGYDGRLDYLNELECVDDLVIANVWQTDRLLVIDPVSGRVVASIDAGPLVDDVSRRATSDIDVLNGVAFDPDSATLWMTGKLWPRLYRVRIVEVA